MKLFGKEWWKKDQTVTTKARASTQGYSLCSISERYPEKINPTKDFLRLMQMDRGTAHTVNTLVADEFASWTRKLFAVVETDKTSKMLTPHGVCKKSFSEALSKSAKINLRNDAKTFVEVYDHPFLNLMLEPWKGWNEFQFFSYLMQQLGVIGNAYVVKHFDGSGQLTGLEPLMGEYVQVTVDRKGQITKYEYRPQCDFPFDARTFDPSEIVHFRQMENGSTVMGKGTLFSVQIPAMLSANMEQYASALYANDCTPALIVNIKGMSMPIDPATGLPDKAKLKEFKQEWMDANGGDNRRGMHMQFGSDTEYKTIASNAVDTGLPTLAPLMESKILQAWHVSDSIFKGGDANKSIMEQASKNLRKFGVLPKAINIITTLNREIIQPYYDTSLLYWWDVLEVEGTDPVETKDILCGYKQAGIYSTNDCLAKLGEPLKEGEQYNTPIAANASQAVQSQAAGITTTI